MSIIVRDANALNPYRVEWRHNLAANWSLMEQVETHDLAVEKADAVREQFGGQTRLIVQHVIEVAWRDHPAPVRSNKETEA